MGQDQSTPSGQHNNLLDGWASSYPEHQRQLTTPVKRTTYQPSFLEQHVQSTEKPPQPTGMRKYAVTTTSSGSADSYMMAHAKKAAAALPTSPASTRFKHETAGIKHSFGGDSIVPAQQRKVQAALSPPKPVPENHTSHVGGDAWILDYNRKAAEGEKGINGITSVWNKFSSDNSRLKDGTPAHQELEDFNTKSAIALKKNTLKAETPSEHVGVKPNINMTTVENAHATAVTGYIAPNKRSNYQGIKPNRPPDDYMLTDIKTKRELLHAGESEFEERPYIFPDDYMIAHTKAVSEQIGHEPLRHEMASLSPPSVAPTSYVLTYAQETGSQFSAPVTPASTDKYVGRRAHVGADSFLLASTRKVAAQLSPFRSRETKGNVKDKQITI